MARTLQFNIGAITCTVLSDGSNTMDVEQIAKTMPASEEDIAAAYEALDLDVAALENHYNCLLIQTDDDTILVDTGFGIGRNEHTGQIFEGMAEHDVQPTDITKVIITHAHGDHIYGLTDEEDNLNFPNATVLFNAVEWNYWYAQGKAKGPALTVLEKVKPQKHGFFVNEEIVPGVLPLAAYGHTPGHTALLIESEGEQMVHLVDTLHRLIQFAHPNWSITFDTHKHQSEPTRRDLLGRAAEGEILTMFYHLPFPGLGHVTQEGDAYRWNPIDV